MQDCLTALKLHATTDDGCAPCPYLNDPNCFSSAINDTIKYIEELEDKIKELENNV